MQRWFYVLLLVVLGACGASEPKEPPKPPRDATYRIFKDGSALGVLKIKAGSFGDFTPSEASGAKEFLERWEKEKVKGTLAVSMHLPTNDGSRGAYGARLYKPTEGDYAEGVTYYLMEEGYAHLEATPDPTPTSSTPQNTTKPQ